MEVSAQHAINHCSKDITTASNVVLVAITLGAIILLFQLFFHRETLGKARNSNLLPPGPRPWPVVGNLLLLGELPHRSLAQLAIKYGALMYLRLGTIPILVVSSAAAAKEVLKTHDQVFANRPVTLASTIFCAKNTNVVLSNGSYWRYIRKMCQLELFNQKRLESFRATRSEEISVTLKSILSESREQKTINLKLKLWTTTANNMTRMIMNKRYFSSEGERSQEAEHFRVLFETLSYWFSLFLIGDYNSSLRWVDKFRGVHTSMRKSLLQLDAFYQEIIDEHRHQTKTIKDGRDSSSIDFVDALLTMPSEDGDGRLADETIRTLIQDMLVAGTDTSSVTTEWAMAELLRHPHVMSRLQAELDDVIGRTRLVNESDLPNLKYLQAVVKETFRLHPAAPLLLPHESSDSLQVGGYTLPPKTSLWINVWAIGQDPSIWNAPLVFQPERFLDHPEIDVKGQNFELIPFGSGRRQCLGIHLGLLMVQLMLAHLVHSFDWSLPNHQTPDTLDMSEKYVLTIRRKGPLHALAQPRLADHLYV